MYSIECSQPVANIENHRHHCAWTSTSISSSPSPFPSHGTVYKLNKFYLLDFRRRTFAFLYKFAQQWWTKRGIHRLSDGDVYSSQSMDFRTWQVHHVCLSVCLSPCLSLLVNLTCWPFVACVKIFLPVTVQHCQFHTPVGRC